MLQRVVIMGYRDRAVFIAPVGIDEGWTVEDRVSMAERSEALMQKLGCGDVHIAVMSGGRDEDIGRIDVVDESITDAVEIVKQLKRKGYNAYDAEILIEDAMEDADLIIAPNGITGNLIFRVMHFLGNAPAFGAPLINSDKVFVDTSRVKTDFTDSIVLAMKLAGMKQ
jgi:predicted methyltransferase MtxX (methanogen marker protein 4)